MLVALKAEVPEGALPVAAKELAAEQVVHRPVEWEVGEVVLETT